jgi:hypothetical protein
MLLATRTERRRRERKTFHVLLRFLELKATSFDGVHPMAALAGKEERRKRTMEEEMQKVKNGGARFLQDYEAIVS